MPFFPPGWFTKTVLTSSHYTPSPFYGSKESSPNHQGSNNGACLNLALIIPPEPNPTTHFLELTSLQHQRPTANPGSIITFQVMWCVVSPYISGLYRVG